MKNIILFLLLFCSIGLSAQVRPDQQPEKTPEGTDAIYTQETGQLRKVLFDSAFHYFIPRIKTDTLTYSIISANNPDSLRGFFVVDNTATWYYVDSAAASVSIGSGGGGTTQLLSFSDPNLSISGGNTVDLSALKDGTGTDDQTAAEVPVTPTGNLSSTDVQAALEEHQSDIDALSSGAADGVTTAGVYDATNEEIDFTVSAPGTNFSVNLSPFKDSILAAEGDPVWIADSINYATKTYTDQAEQDAKDYADANDDSGTDDQTLSFSNPNLSIENGNSLDLSSVLPFFRSGGLVVPNFTSTNMELRLNSTETYGGNLIRSRIGAEGDFLWAVGDDGSLFGQGRNGLSAYVYGNYPFIVATNAARRLIVTGSGDVGINTLNPNFKLEVNGTVGFPVLSDGSSHTELVTRNDATGELGYATNNISNWNTAFGWGDHSTAGYLTSEVDGSTTNELQTISVSGDDIALSDGGGSVSVINTVESNTAASTTITIDLESARNRVVQIDMTSASTASTVTLSASNPVTGGVYTFHLQNTNTGGHDVDFPTNFLKADGTAWDESTTVNYAADEWLTCYYDGTNFYCK